MIAPHLQRGKASEEFARRWLEQRGLQCLYTNFSCRYGELDLVMLDHGCLVVVEVRYRQRKDFGSPLHSVTAQKQHKICRATQCLLQKYHALGKLPLRFDVLALSGSPDKPEVRWCRHAFEFHA